MLQLCSGYWCAICFKFGILLCCACIALISIQLFTSLYSFLLLPSKYTCMQQYFQAQPPCDYSGQTVCAVQNTNNCSPVLLHMRTSYVFSFYLDSSSNPVHPKHHLGKDELWYLLNQTPQLLFILSVNFVWLLFESGKYS